MFYLMLRLGGGFFSSALPTSCWRGAGMLLQREPLRLSLASFSVPWVLGAAAVYPVSHQQLQASLPSAWQPQKQKSSTFQTVNHILIPKSVEGGGGSKTEGL